MHFRKILIAVTSSPHALKAAEAGFSLAGALGAEVALIYVIDRNKEAVNVEASPTHAQSEMLLLKEAQETIAQLHRMYGGVRPLNQFTPEGFPKEQILQTAKEWEADLIVMSTHGKKAFSHLFQSSITEAVIKQAGVPVLLIPPQVK